MQRRRFIGVTATGALGAAAVGLAERKAAASAPQAKPRVRGDVVASWPAFLDALYRGPRSIADTVARLTDGKFVIDVHPGGGELVSPIDIMPAVSEGRVQMGHSASYDDIDSMGAGDRVRDGHPLRPHRPPPECLALRCRRTAAPATLDLLINGDAWNELPQGYRDALELAAYKFRHAYDDETDANIPSHADSDAGLALHAAGAAGTPRRSAEGERPAHSRL
jgi:TRAP-type mannitol/chloroaromatic compound transport system substrate-binding protein